MQKLDGSVPDGLWCVSDRAIYIRKGLAASRARHIYGHELQHALVDACHEWDDM
jgi:hypothetical protein